MINERFEQPPTQHILSDLHFIGLQDVFEKICMLRTKATLVTVQENHRLELSRGMHGQVTVRLLIRSQLHPHSQGYFVSFSE